LELRSSFVKPPVTRVARSAWNNRRASEGERLIPEEVAVGFVYNGRLHAVIMATPQDLEDFALGFSIAEEIVSSSDDVRHLEIVEQDVGIELRIWLSGSRSAALNESRRHGRAFAGRGFGGLQDLAEALREPPQVGSGRLFSPTEIMRAADSLALRRELDRQTRAVHAAAFWEPEAGLVALREDIAGSNALDKLGGALARDRISGQLGMVVLTSGACGDSVQRAAALDVPVLATLAAPTALAVRAAETAGITLVAVVRGNGFEVFTHPRRVARETAAHVA
jgi:FdhD protein